jgi:hypothetical protein
MNELMMVFARTKTLHQLMTTVIEFYTEEQVCTNQLCFLPSAKQKVKIKQLESLGFTQIQAVAALRRCGGDVGKAADYLWSTPEYTTTVNRLIAASKQNAATCEIALKASRGDEQMALLALRGGRPASPRAAPAPAPVASAAAAASNVRWDVCVACEA